MPIPLLDRTPPPADHRIPYGPDRLQFGDLRLPSLAPGQLAPVAVFLHGGWWKAEYGLGYGGHLCAALKAHGVVTWSLEYRRLGDAGGGWPGTFQDVAAGYRFLKTLAARFPLDLRRLVVMGHSAGGHLAFWLAGTPHVPPASPIAVPDAGPQMRALVGLAGAVDLRLILELAGDGTFAHDRERVTSFMGGTPEQVPQRFRAGNPGDLLPLNVPQWLFQGTEDDQIPPELPPRWAQRGRRIGEKVEVRMLPGADHFDVVDPQSAAWPEIQRTILHLLS